MTTQELPPPPQPPLDDRPRPNRFTSEVMAGGSVVEKDDDELVGGVRGALGVAAIVALFVVLGLFSIWWMVFALGVLIAIFFHELGHFATAKWSGMKATQFFIGFGPRVWSFRRGETEYGVRALPLGAFVRIIGMNQLDEVEPGDEDRTYMSKSYPKRLLVISAGSIMHMILAVMLLFTVYVTHGEDEPRDGAAVSVPAADSDSSSVTGAALTAGVEPGDVIVAVDGVAVDDSATLGEAVRSHAAGDTVTITVLRGGPTPETATTLDLEATLGSSLDIDGPLVAVAGESLSAGSDATVSEALAAADVGAGDVVVAEYQVDTAADGSPIVRATPAQVVELADGSLAIEGTALLGVSTHDNSELVEHSVGGAAVNAVVDIFPATWEMTKGIPKVLNPVNIFTHLAGTNDDVSSRPTTLVGITGVSDDVGETQGVAGILYMLAILNVFVGLFNMLPLLPLDGGHAAIATYERIREGNSGRRYYADVAKLTPYAMAVMTVLMLLFVSGLYLDIARPIG